MFLARFLEQETGEPCPAALNERSEFRDCQDESRPPRRNKRERPCVAVFCEGVVEVRKLLCVRREELS